MFETFRSIRGHMLTGAVGCLVLGVVLLLFPDAFLQVACYVIGALFIAYGVLGILGCVRERAIRMLTVVMSVVAAAVGIFIITNPRLIGSILPIVFGLILLLDGLLNTRQGIGLRRFGDPSGTTVLILGVITLVLGVVILLNPYATATVSFRLIGAALLYNGLSDLLILLRMNRAHKTYQKQKVIDVEARPVDDDEEDV